MKRLVSLLCAAVFLGAMLCGCVQRAAENVSDKASEVVDDIKKDAETFGKTEDDQNGMIGENATEAPTLVNMDEMIENGVIDDENDDDYDGDNIDDDKLGDNVDNDSDDDIADGGEHNDETVDDNSSFI